MARAKETCVITLRSSTGALDTSSHTIKFQPADSSYPTNAIDGVQLASLSSYEPASDLDEKKLYYIYVDGTRTFSLPPLYESFAVWLSGVSFTKNEGTFANGGIKAADAFGVIFADVNIPRSSNYRGAVLEQITVYYWTDESADKFHLSFTEVDCEGDTSQLEYDVNIGEGETGYSSKECLSTPVALSDLPNYLAISMQQADTDAVIIYGVKLTGYFY